MITKAVSWERPTVWRIRNFVFREEYSPTVPLILNEQPVVQNQGASLRYQQEVATAWHFASSAYLHSAVIIAVVLKYIYRLAGPVSILGSVRSVFIARQNRLSNHWATTTGASSTRTRGDRFGKIAGCATQDVCTNVGHGDIFPKTTAINVFRARLLDKTWWTW